MNVIPIIRIAAVVGLSAVKLITTAMQMKQAKEDRMLPFGHFNPQPVYPQPMYSNPYYTQPQQPIFETRRMCQPPQPVMQIQPQPIQRPVQPFTSYRGCMTEQYYTQPMNTYEMAASRRWGNPQVNMNQMYIPQQPPMMNYQQPYMPQYNPELEWCNKSIGQMREEQYMNTQPNYWSQPRGCSPPGRGGPNDIVAMFYTNDGRPLFGPSQFGYV